MKRLEAFIQPHRLNKVIRALHELPRFPGCTICNAHGQGHGRGTGGHYSFADAEGLHHQARCIVVIYCADEEADSIACTIQRSAHTGHAGDGFVAVSDCPQCLRIRDEGGGA